TDAPGGVTMARVAPTTAGTRSGMSQSSATPNTADTPSPGPPPPGDELRQRFEAAWRAGARRAIEEYLARATGPGRPRPLRELVALEVGLRLEGGEHPAWEEYEARFPEYGALIGDIFQAAPTGTFAPDRPPRPPALPAVRPTKLGPYRILREVGRGG